MDRSSHIVATVLAIVACATLAAPPVDATPAPRRTIAPAEVGSGELLRQTDAGLVPLPVVDIDVDIAVSGVMLRGRVTQTFRNPTAEVIEVVYAFPLPHRAAVHHMEMQIGDRRIVSIVQEKRQAQRTYEVAKAEGRKTALVGQDFGNLFTTKAANIDPFETIEVTLEYLEEVAWVDDGFELRFPLTFVPRFTPPLAGPLPPSRAGGGTDATSDGTFTASLTPGASCPPDHASATAPGRFLPSASVRVTVDAGFSLATVTSLSHAIAADVRDTRAKVTTDPEQVAADRDFLLRWTPVRKGEPEARVLIEEREDGRYGLVMLMPPHAEGDVGRGLPTETLFVIDVSGSMDGPPLQQAREALLAALDRLRPEDRFNIIKFSDHHTTFATGFVQAEGNDLRAARDWVRALRVEGGTMILPALVAGMELLGQSRSAHAQRIVFLTDGAVSNEPAVLDAVVARLGDARLHTIGIGHAPNGWLMRKMAWHGRGMCVFISDARRAREGIEQFFGRLERPVLTDVELSWNGPAPQDLLPARLPDLYAGEPLYLSFRLAPGETPSALTVGGHSRVGRLERTAPLAEKTARDAGLAVRWARARVDTLMDSLYEGADADFVRGEVVDVALDFSLVTLYTSLVAVDHGQDDVEAAGGRQVAALLPQGGTDAGLRWFAGLLLIGAGLGLLPFVVRRA